MRNEFSRWCNDQTYENYLFNGDICTFYGLDLLEYWLLGSGLSQR